MVISIVAAVLVLMVGAWWILNRMNANSEHNQAGSCPAGDLTLVVAAQDNPQVQSLLDSYKKSNPVVKDRCVGIDSGNKRDRERTPADRWPLGKY